MGKTIYITLGLVILNLVFIWVHRIMFQSSEPFLVIITILIHFFVITKIPYKKIYNSK
jgi:putative effector of murein hydrolase